MAGEYNDLEVTIKGKSSNNVMEANTENIMDVQLVKKVNTMEEDIMTNDQLTNKEKMAETFSKDNVTNEVQIGLKDKIINVIKDIRKGRARPCYQSIHTSVNSDGDFTVDMETLKVILNNMVEENFLRMVKKGGKESFYINIEELNEDNNKHGEDNDIFEYVNEKFLVTLRNMIEEEATCQINKDSFKEGVANFIKEEIKFTFDNLNLDKSDNITPHVVSKDFKDTETLINSLNNEISFLRQEVQAKNKIIELLIVNRNFVNNDASKSIDDDANYVNDRNKSLLNTVNHDDVKDSLNKNTPTGNKLVETENNFASSADTDKNKFNKFRNDGIKKSVTIIGDSMVKGIQPFKMKRSLTNKEKLYVKTFAGAKIEDIYDYAKPTMRYNPDVVILHCGTNNLNDDKAPNVTADDIIKLASNLKTDENDIMISGITLRNDKHQEKVQRVNDYLKIKSANYGIKYIDNSNLNRTHLNPKGIHLNLKGSEALAANFISAINS